MTDERPLQPSQFTPKRKMGRPRLSSPERRRRILASKAKWRDANFEYYKAQKNRLSSRPEYKERRKELRARAKALLDLSVLHDEARERGWATGLQYDDRVGGLVPVPESTDSSDDEMLGIVLPPGYEIHEYVSHQTNDQVGSGAPTPNEEAR